MSESFGSHTHPAEFLMTTTPVNFMPSSSQFVAHSVARSFGTLL
ncbi:hypothetical protein D187_008651 [Cystobacter fuscus DSM 2262]|uniref:Uncharacterized protein n=1 Tax=Cystobacter fuscus (strain ATCC 25194 / DSM 2262 / NBRC 100088 / M29) TaxID=1242864 RepID=S9R0M4_CYSF2|nr:hypothetical protein D187_008651 [Cystobacter fuscus DSM 2262]